jgi:hypothetical protein
MGKINRRQYKGTNQIYYWLYDQKKEKEKRQVIRR